MVGERSSTSAPHQLQNKYPAGNSTPHRYPTLSSHDSMKKNAHPTAVEAPAEQIPPVSVTVGAEYSQIFIRAFGLHQFLQTTCVLDREVV